MTLSLIPLNDQKRDWNCHYHTGLRAYVINMAENITIEFIEVPKASANLQLYLCMNEGFYAVWWKSSNSLNLRVKPFITKHGCICTHTVNAFCLPCYSWFMLHLTQMVHKLAYQAYLGLYCPLVEVLCNNFTLRQSFAWHSILHRLQYLERSLI